MFNLMFCHRSEWDEQFGRLGQLFFYLADESGNVLSLSREYLNNREDSLLASGSRIDIGDWQLHLKSMVISTKTCYGKIFKILVLLLPVETFTENWRLIAYNWSTVL